MVSKRIAPHLLAVSACLVGVYACGATQFQNVSHEPKGPSAEPPALGQFSVQAPVASPDQWRAERAPKLREMFETTIYGRMPKRAPVRIAERKTLQSDAFDGLGSIEELTLDMVGLKAPDGATMGLHLVLVTPKTGGPHPLIIAQNFCGNRVALAGVAEASEGRTPPPPFCKSELGEPAIKMIFGQHINAPPFEAILKKGYALALYYAAEIVPDDKITGQEALKALTPAGAEPEHRTGAIAAWAWTFSQVVDALENDPKIDKARIAVWGHSRNGKSALLAATYDERIGAVIALQPGTAGASLARNGIGESIAEITRSYPHWFSPTYATFAGRENDLPVDQHQLVGMIAPRPVLIGASRRDRWSDPQGAFRAVEGASPVYELFGAQGFKADKLSPNANPGPLSFYMRPGFHGVQASDWRRTLEFLDAQWASKSGGYASGSQ